MFFESLDTLIRTVIIIVVVSIAEVSILKDTDIMNTRYYVCIELHILSNK